MFKKVIWNERPRAVTKLADGRYRVTRKVELVSDTDETGTVHESYYGEEAIMSEAAYAAYVGAMEVAERREQEIIDDYTMELINGGVI